METSWLCCLHEQRYLVTGSQEWMEGAAIVCARNFTRNSNVVTIAMDNLFFMKPILPTVQVQPDSLLC